MLREVRAMGLTWRDLASSAVLVAMILAYWALLFRTGPALISSAWATSAVELVLGSICAVTAAIDLHTRPQPRAGRIVRRITTVFGSVALVAGLAGMAGNSTHAVEILVVAMAWLWFAATVWHVYTIGSEA
jgi:hypothetical protein